VARAGDARAAGTTRRHVGAKIVRLERDLDHEPACEDAIRLYEERIATVERRTDALADVHRSLRTRLEHLRGS
jgi:hypothetical protein